jgi:hypothetical protein
MSPLRHQQEKIQEKLKFLKQNKKKPEKARRI